MILCVRYCIRAVFRVYLMCEYKTFPKSPTFNQKHDFAWRFQLVHHVLQRCGSNDVRSFGLIVQKMSNLNERHLGFYQFNNVNNQQLCNQKWKQQQLQQGVPILNILPTNHWVLAWSIVCILFIIVRIVVVVVISVASPTTLSSVAHINVCDLPKLN